MIVPTNDGSVSAGDVARTTAPVPVLVVEPDPPFATGKVPVTPVVRLTFVTVLLAALIVLFVTVCVFVAVSTLLGVMMLDKSAIVIP
jgi:hypothetical protein